MSKKLIIAGLIGILLIIIVVGLIIAQKFYLGKLVFTIAFDERKDLQVGDSIYLKDFKVGKVLDMRLDEIQRVILVKVLLDPPRNIPDDSFFFIWSDIEVEEKKCIQIKLGERSTFIQKGDRVRGESSTLKIFEHVGKEWLKSIDNEFEFSPMFKEIMEDLRN